MTLTCYSAGKTTLYRRSFDVGYDVETTSKTRWVCFDVR